MTAASRLLNDTAVSRLLRRAGIRVSTWTLRRWRRNGVRDDGPPHVKVGGRVLYRREEVEEWSKGR